MNNLSAVGNVQISISNLLIESLPKKARLDLLTSCTTVELYSGEILNTPAQPVLYVYFPIGAVISLVAPSKGHAPMILSMIGIEGMLGATTVLSISQAPLQAIVQNSGNALRVPIKDFQRQLLGNPDLEHLVNNQLYFLIAQLPWSTTCAKFHDIKARLARWMLVAHDHSSSDHFCLTHSALAAMLGVQRSAVTIAAVELQRKKLISYTRGDITVISRQGLEAASCDCYQEVADMQLVHLIRLSRPGELHQKYKASI